MRFLRPDNLSRLVRVALLVFFAWLAGRFWHPYYGFTRFLQMDAESAATTLPELRAAPIFTYEYGYDGHYYAQLAARPAVNDPALGGAIDNVGYRARRMLLSWMAWAAGGGDPVAAVRAYAWLNLVVWAGLAALLWRIFPQDWRGTLAWAGVLFSAGVLHSVRQALTDLLALLLVAGATVLVERNRRGWAAALLGLGGLARETVLLGAVSLLPAEKSPRSDWLRAAGWCALVAAPLALWLFYLRSVLGPTEPGLGNFTLPLAGWIGKWREVAGMLRTEPDHYLALTTFLSLLGLTTQAAVLLSRPLWKDPWWRLGAAYGGLMLLLGSAVWDGHPGAATRVLLPLALAFNVLAARARLGAIVLILGNLSVLSGVLTMWHVPVGAHELAAGRSATGSYVVHTDADWHATEGGLVRKWAWCAEAGGIAMDFEPRTEGTVNLQVAVKGITSRPLEIRQAGRVLWQGEAGAKVQWVALPAVTVMAGRAELEFLSPAAPVLEGPGGRQLGFAVYGVKVD